MCDNNYQIYDMLVYFKMKNSTVIIWNINVTNNSMKHLLYKALYYYLFF